MSNPSSSGNAGLASTPTSNADATMAAAPAPPQVTPNVTGGSVFKSNNPFARPPSGAAAHSPSPAAAAAASTSQADPFQLAELQASLPGGSTAGADADPFAETDQSKAGQEVEQADDSDEERPVSSRTNGRAEATSSLTRPTAISTTDMDHDYAPPDHAPPDTTATSSSPSPQSPSYAPPPHPPPEHERATSSVAQNYAPPSHPPPPEHEAGASRRSTEHGRQPSGLPLGYHPTIVATPGQPLLANRRILLYPLNDPVCPKCRGTGYQRADILNPCRKCWDKYGRPMRMIETGELDPRRYALQAPLPSLSHGHTSMTGSPSAVPSPVRRGPPKVGRSAEADEELADENGEVPPSYDDSIRTSEPLPPRRAGETNVTSSLPPTVAHPPPSGAGRLPFAPPLISFPQGSSHHGGGGYPGAQHHHPHQQGPYHSGWGAPQHAPFPQHPHHSPMGHHGGGMSFVAPIPHGRRPPPGALVLPPGDPRLGGQLCMKCGGDGETESFWLGSETCSRCRGVGRIF